MPRVCSSFRFAPCLAALAGLLAALVAAGSPASVFAQDAPAEGLLAALVGPASALAQEAPAGLPPEKDLTQLVYDEWTTEDGLPHRTVGDILQTRDGYLWLATGSGLARFDGVSFTVFDKANTPAFRRNSLTSLAEGPDGALWIGTYGGGVLRYRDGAFEHFGSEDGLGTDVITDVDVAPDGTVWIATIGAGASRYADGQFTTVGRDDGLRHNTTRAVYADSSGGAWIGTNSGVDYVPAGAARADTAFAARLPYAPQTLTARVFAPTADGDGLWVGGAHGIYRTAWDGRSHERLQPGRLSDTRDSISTISPSALYEDERGTLWIGTGGGGLLRVTAGGAVDTLAGDDLIGRGIGAFYEDREGSLWIGTDGGLARLRDGAFTTYSTAQGLPATDADAVRQLSDGRIIALSGNRINVFSEEKNRFVPFEMSDAARRTIAEALPDRLAPGTPMSKDALTQTPDGALWVGGKCGPLARLETDGSSVQMYDATGEHRYECTDALVPRDSGGVWLAGDGGGLLHLADGRVFEHDLDGVSSLVFTLLKARDSTLWIGMWPGLGRLRGDSLRVFREEDGLGAPQVISLFEDASGTVWAGTGGGGLTRARGDSLTTFTARDGLFDDVVYAITQSRAGALWMSTDKGIFQMEKSALAAFEKGEADEIEITAFTARHGLPDGRGHTWSDPKAWRASDGRLWFATQGGAAVVDPQELQPNETPPPVHIERFTAGGDTVAQDSKIRLAPGAEDFAFHYAGLSYVAPEQVRFRYRLDGRDEAWTDAGSRRAAFYTDLDPGRYTFRVKAANADGVWNDEGAQLSFVLEPHFYETAWFYLLCALGLAALGYGGYRWRVRQLRRRQRELEGEVEERTHELRSEKETTERLYARLEKDNERKTRELEEAREIQLSMLPKEAPSTPALDVAVHMRTATEVGGDYYDFRLPENGGADDALLAAIGDATGHGMKAGLVVATAKSRFQALDGGDATGGDLTGTVRRLSQNLKDLELRQMFMSFALVACRGRRVRLVGAGMPPALWYRAAGERVEEVPLKGAPLGSFPDFPYREHGLSLAEGDALLFMSDGLMELRGGTDRELLGQPPIADAFREAAPRGAKAVIERLEALARHHAGDRPPDDDITLLVLVARA